jgi:FMN phosphatase YigB (HAD superfamily)
MKFKAIIFDADGVLIKSNGYFSEHLSKLFNIPVENIMPFFKEEFQLCLEGKADLRVVVKPWLKKWNWNSGVDNFLHFWFSMEDVVDLEITAYLNILKQKGYKLFMATKNEMYRVEYLKNNVGFGKFLDKIYSSAELGYKKPRKEFYEAMLSDLKLQDIEPKDCLYFDDDEENVESARSLGIESIFVKESVDCVKILQTI